jgi:hypothetical protein
MKHVYIARQNENLDDGRGGTLDVAHFFSEADASAVSDMLPGVFGTANTCEVGKLEVYESIEEYCYAAGIETPSVKKIKERALKKLTDEEKKALRVGHWEDPK